MDIWSRIVGLQKRKKYEYYSTFLEQSTQIHRKRSMVYIRTSDLYRNSKT